MTLIENVRTKLLADATVAGLVTGVHAMVVPQEATYPAVVLSVVGESPILAQEQTRATRLCRSMLQVDCYADRYVNAHAVAAAVDVVLSALADPSDLTAQRQVSLDGYENETQLYRVTADYAVFHGVETVP